MKKKKGEGTYNVVVIGAGTAGLVTAAGTAGLGGRVALIERDKMGGDCLNTGCVPSKALISSARLLEQIRRAEEWGLEKQEPMFEFGKVFARMRERRAKIAPNDSVERFESLGVDVFRGQARLISPHEVAVGETVLKGRNIVIAAGSRPALPRFDGMEEVRHYTSETIFDDLEEKPSRLLVLGGGPTGCELGQVFARLGVAVTIAQKASRILEKEDADAVGVLRKRLEAEKIRILTGVEAKMAVRQGDTVRVWIEGDGDRRPLDCDAILIAAGRSPNTEGLDLEKAGVEYGPTGIRVNASLQTSQPNIYAAGDIAGPYQFTHVAEAHARVVVRNILFPWKKARFDDMVVPGCIYTDPEIARVGLNEDQARKRGIAYDVWTEPLEKLDRAVVESAETGFAKVLTAKGKDEILGVTLVAERAGDLLHEFVLAMKAGVGLKRISGTIHAYPTFAELAKRLADQHQRQRLTPFAKRAFAWLYGMQRRSVR